MFLFCYQNNQYYGIYALGMLFNFNFHLFFLIKANKIKYKKRIKVVFFTLREIY